MGGDAPQNSTQIYACARRLHDSNDDDYAMRANQ